MEEEIKIIPPAPEPHDSWAFAPISSMISDQIKITMDQMASDKSGVLREWDQGRLDGLRLALSITLKVEEERNAL